MPRLRWLLMWLVRIVLLFALGFALGLVIRVGYLGDDLIFVWPWS